MQLVIPRVLSAAVAMLISASAASALSVPDSVEFRLKQVAPEVSVSSLSHAEVYALINVLNSSDGPSERKARVRALVETFSR